MALSYLQPRMGSLSLSNTRNPMNPDKPLTQQEFIQRLKDDLETAIGTARVHAMVAQGMPVVSNLGTKPRFHYPTCRTWILAARELDPLTLATRDRLFKRQLKRTG